MAMTPQGLTISAIAVELAMDRRTVAGRVSDLTPISQRNGAKVYSLGDVIRVFAAKSPSHDHTIGGHKERLLKARADQAEYDAGESAGRLLDRIKITHLVTTMIVRVKTKLLGVPIKAAPLVAVESETEPCRAIIEKLIHECLADLKSTDRRLAGVDWSGTVPCGDVGRVGPSIEVDDQPMGGRKKEAKLGG